NVIQVTLPPLRERPEDIPLLVEHFLDRFGKENEKPIRKVTDAALGRLLRYPWPGNVRELENTIERGVVLARGEEIGLDLLPREIQEEVSLPVAASLPEGMDFYGAVLRYERQLIE